MEGLSEELIILSSLLGVLTGGFLSLTFFRLEKIWERFLVSILIAGAPIPALTLIFQYFAPSLPTRAWCYIVYLVTLMLCFIAVLLILLKRLRSINDSYLKIRDIDILLGYKNSITDYYNNRVKEANLEIEKLQSQKNKLNNIENELNRREQILKEKEDALNQQSNDGIKIIFPINFTFPITNEFLNGIPNYTRQLQRFAFYSSLLADDLGKEYKKMVSVTPDEDGSQAVDMLRKFTISVCAYATNYLFSMDVRSHFRYLHNNEIYKSLVTSFDDEGIKHVLTPIPKDTINLITQSEKVRKSLIRNFNPDYDYQTGNQRWNNYLTITLTEHIFLNNEGFPILSMGISIEDQLYENMLRFLNFIGFERIIEQHFVQFNRYVDCNKAIKYLSLRT